MALHGLGDRALPLVEPGVVQRQSRPAADVLQQGQIIRGERLPPARAAQSQGAQHLPHAPDRRDGRGVDARLREQAGLPCPERGVRREPRGGPCQRGGDPTQRPCQRQQRVLRDGGEGPLEVLAPHQAAVPRVHDGRPVDPAALGDQVDDRPVGELRRDQPHQPAQRLLDVQGGGQLGGGLRQQGQPLQLGQRAAEPVARGARLLRVVRRVEHHQRADRPVVRTARCDQPGHREERPVAALEPLLLRLHGAARHVGPPHPALGERQGGAVPAAVQQLVRVPAQEVPGRPSQELLGPRVHGHDRARRVHHVRAGVEGRQQRGQRRRHGPGDTVRRAPRVVVRHAAAPVRRSARPRSVT